MGTPQIDHGDGKWNLVSIWNCEVYWFFVHDIPTCLQVQGIGSPNPFRLRSLLGARIPLNATYSPLITMYNPFSTSLQVSQTENKKRRFYLIKFLNSSSYLCSQIILALLELLQGLHLLLGHLIALCWLQIVLDRTVKVLWKRLIDLSLRSCYCIL